MKTTTKSKIVVLVSCLVYCCIMQQQARAQWVPNGQYDYYKSEEERLRALDQSLTLLEKANPMVDLRAALSKGDVRWVAYTGYGLAAPGVPRKEFISAFGRRNGFKTLKGSTDVLPGNLAERLNKVIQNYMKPYNIALLRYLAKRKTTRRK